MSPTPASRDGTTPPTAGGTGISQLFARPLIVDNDNANAALIVDVAGDARLPRSLCAALYGLGFAVPEIRIRVRDGRSQVCLTVTERDGGAPEPERRRWALDAVHWVTGDAERLPDAAE